MTPINLAEKARAIHVPLGSACCCRLQRQRHHGGEVQRRISLHLHEDTDDFFLVLDGEMEMDPKGGAPRSCAKASFSLCPRASLTVRGRLRNARSC